MRHRLVVAANRLPIRRTPAGGWAESSGGLVSAVGSVLSGSREAAWVGWDGSVGGGPLAPPRHPVDLYGVSLTAAEVEGFYEGFSNRTLWPLYHDRIRPPEIRESWWDRYVEVNGRYAARLAGLLAPGGTAWVHDYHLHLVPGMLRRLRPDARIGFFLHIPFPPPEVFLQLPWRREVAEGLLGADLVGFQTPLAASNFRRVVRWLGLGRPAGPRLDARRHHIEVRSFPISIDVAAFETLSSDPATGAAARGLRRSWGEPAKVLLGVDRLDYTKGITSRLRAFAGLLERSGRRDVVLVQVAVPTREGIPAYRRYREEVQGLVEEINGRWADRGHRPVVSVDRALDRAELVAHYRAADVMCVTPLRDGMNLVAKEYVASRVDGGGTLVLSELAGAARELREAVLVNPYDENGMATAFQGSLERSPAAAAARMEALRRRVRENDVGRWAASFLGALQGEPRLGRPVASVGPPLRPEPVEMLEGA